jgi:predicted transcriptional regulator
MKSNSLQIRLSDRRKHKLMLYAAQKDRTITALIEEWIDSLVLEKERETAG